MERWCHTRSGTSGTKLCLLERVREAWNLPEHQNTTKFQETVDSVSIYDRLYPRRPEAAVPTEPFASASVATN